MLIVVALGGNALLPRGERPDTAAQRRHAGEAARAVAPLTARHHLIICHGNGPQVGLLAAENEQDPALSAPSGLDTLGAQTQGMIGYWLVQELRNARVRQHVVALVSQTLVNPADAAFSRPDKFIGPGYDEPRARALAARLGWTVAADGAAWRRVVPSPRPLGLIEVDTVRALCDAGTLVVCGGGGGVPVALADDGTLTGVEAVVDKDLTAAALAIDLSADRLLVLTDVPAVMADFGTPAARPIPALDTAELDRLTFPAGSMGPKVAACAEFARVTGRPAAIGALTDAAAILAGQAGTTITSRRQQA